MSLVLAAQVEQVRKKKTPKNLVDGANSNQSRTSGYRHTHSLLTPPALGVASRHLNTGRSHRYDQTDLWIMNSPPTPPTSDVEKIFLNTLESFEIVWKTKLKLVFIFLWLCQVSAHTHSHTHPTWLCTLCAPGQSRLWKQFFDHSLPKLERH